MMRGERIADIPAQYRGAWSYHNLGPGNVPWEPFDSFLTWLSQCPYLFYCVGEETGIAILKRVMGYKWTQIGWERFWYVNASQRMAETFRFLGVENNIQDALTTINVVMFSEIDRVEPKHQDRLLNILIARKMAGKATLFSTYKSLSTLNEDLQEFLCNALVAE